MISHGAFYGQEEPVKRAFLIQVFATAMRTGVRANHKSLGASLVGVKTQRWPLPTSAAHLESTLYHLSTSHAFSDVRPLLVAGGGSGSLGLWKHNHDRITCPSTSTFLSWADNARHFLSAFSVQDMGQRKYVARGSFLFQQETGTYLRWRPTTQRIVRDSEYPQAKMRKKLQQALRRPKKYNRKHFF